MKCKHCATRTAQPRRESSFQLCSGCAYELCPGRDVALWQRLFVKYGYRAA